MDFYFKLVGSGDDPEHEYNQRRHVVYDQVDMWFGEKSTVKDGDVLFLYAVNTSRIRYLYGYAIVIGKDNYKATNHPKWKWSRGILPVKVITDLRSSLVHDLDNPLHSQIFPLKKSRKDASITWGVGGCVKIKEDVDGYELLNKINSLDDNLCRNIVIEDVIESMKSSHPNTAIKLESDREQWITYAENLKSR